MEIKTFYTTLEKPGKTEYKDRGSRFIAEAFPLASAELFKEKLLTTKKDHPKANHHCFAYRIGLDGNNFRVSDDGEPAGTAGKPILGQIDSKELTNMGIIVVRYFGGTLLGVPGLINAYKTSAALVLQTVPVIQQPIETVYLLEFDYTLINQVMMIIKQFNCSLINQDIQLFCLFRIGIPVARREEVLYRLKELHSIGITAC